MMESTIDNTKDKYISNKLLKWHKATRVTILVISACFSIIVILGILLLVLLATSDNGHEDIEAAMAFVAFMAILIFGFLGASLLGIGAIALKWPLFAGIALYGISCIFIYIGIIARFGYGAEIFVLVILWSIAAFFATTGTINIAVWHVSRNNSDNSLHIHE